MRYILAMPLLTLFLWAWLNETLAVQRNAPPEPVSLWMRVPTCYDDGDYVCVIDRAQRVDFNRKQYASVR